MIKIRKIITPYCLFDMSPVDDYVLTESFLPFVESLRRDGYDVRPHPDGDNSFIIEEYEIDTSSEEKLASQLRRLIVDVLEERDLNGFLLQREVLVAGDESETESKNDD